MIDDIIREGQSRMEKSLEALNHAFSKLRTGRAHPSLLDQVTVDYYGNETPLSQVANVTAADARTLAITPWEKTMVAPIEKAIMTSDLGLNPSTAGQIIRVPLPPLTEERRKDLTKLVKAEAEQGRVSVRNARRDMNTHFKDLVKDKEISEDDQRKAEARAQKLTDDYITKIEHMTSEKEQDLMAI